MPLVNRPHQPAMSPAIQRVLVLDGHSKAAAQAVLALPVTCELHVAAISLPCLAGISRRVRKAFDQPAGIEPLSSWLIQMDAQHDYCLILPCTESSLLALKASSLPATLRAKAVLADEVSIDVALSKAETCKAALHLGIPVPQSLGYASQAQADSAGPLPLPVVIKPVRSKVWVDGKLITLGAQVCHSQTQRDAARMALLKHTEVIEQRYVPGRGVGIEVLFDRGQLRWLFAHERLHEMPITGGASTYRRRFDAPAALVNAAVNLMTHLRWHGVAMVEFKLDANGSFHLIEINPRLWGSLPLAVAAGFNFPAALLKMAAGFDPGPQPKPTRCRYVRDAAADIHWMAQSLRYRHQPLRLKALSPGDWLGWFRPLMGLERWDLFSLREPELWWAISAPTVTAFPRRLQRMWRQRKAAGAARKSWNAHQAGWQSASLRKVVVLCRGNICRSPVAAMALQSALPHAEVVSAGFHPRAGRSSPEPWAEVVARRLEIDLTAHRSRTVDAELMAWADLVIAMDVENWNELERTFPQVLHKSTLLAIAAGDPGAPGTEIPDPYGLPVEQMERIAIQLAKATDQLAAKAR